MAKTESKKIEINVDALKRQHGTVYELRIPRNDDGTEFAVGYIRKPKRNELVPIIPQMQSNPIGSMEILLNTVWLAGDDEIKDDDDLFFGAIQELQNIVTFRVAELKKI